MVISPTIYSSATFPPAYPLTYNGEVAKKCHQFALRIKQRCLKNIYIFGEMFGVKKCVVSLKRQHIAVDEKEEGDINLNSSVLADINEVLAKEMGSNSKSSSRSSSSCSNSSCTSSSTSNISTSSDESDDAPQSCPLPTAEDAAVLEDGADDIFEQAANIEVDLQDISKILQEGGTCESDTAADRLTSPKLAPYYEDVSFAEAEPLATSTPRGEDMGEQKNFVNCDFGFSVIDIKNEMRDGRMLLKQVV